MIQMDRAMSRREAFALGITAITGVGVGYLGRTPEAGNLSVEKLVLEHKPAAFGGGLSLLGPFKGSNGGQVFLRSIFTYGPQFVICTVETNLDAFIFPTATLGEVPLDPNTFSMYMGNSAIDKTEYQGEGAQMSLTLSGHLDCHTEAITASGKFGGRDIAEPADFEATASGGKDFSITVFFDKDKAPVNSAIFGPKFTFKGNITDGSTVVTTVGDLVSIVKPTGGGGGEG